MRHLFRLLIVAIGLWPPVAFGQPLTADRVPEPLRPWISWVEQARPERACPFLFNDHHQTRCAWPTQLRLDLDDRQGRFTGVWHVQGEQWLTLPGDGAHWPQQVRVNGRPGLVMDREGAPAVLVAADNRPAEVRVSGSFGWDTLPDHLPVPADTGLLGLLVNGQPVALPSLSGGQLWLKNGQEAGQAGPAQRHDGLDIQVFRKITDTVPMQVLTRLLLQVSGDQREIRLPNTVPAQFLPQALDSPLPARLEADGQLLLQLRPGLWQVDVLSRSLQAVAELAPPAQQPQPPPQDGQAPWPGSELWAFQAQPELRVVHIRQLEAVDPNLTNLPQEWRHLPTYRISQGQAMRFALIQRGDPDPAPNRLSLHRRLWLDFDGGGYTVHDAMAGLINRDWRLNAAPPMRLGQVTVDGAPQLITVQPGGQQHGVAVRPGRLALEADSRILGPIGRLSAAGWSQDFDTLRAELNLPPGWRLLAASGVDNVPSSWLAQWSLLDLFLVLIAALATARLWHGGLGLLALLTLTLTWHEPDAPRQVWLHILAATALARALPAGKAQRLADAYRQLCWLALALLAAPFMVAQAKTALYPQLETPVQAAAPWPADGQQLAQPLAGHGEDLSHPPPEAAEPPAAMAMAPPGHHGLYALPSTPYPRIAKAAPERPELAANVQTGPGLPQWRWHTIELRWHGPVGAGQELGLWYLSPTMTAWLNGLRVLLLAGLALMLYGPPGPGPTPPRSWPWRRLFRPGLWLVLLPLCAVPGPNAHAQFPDAALLAELKNRLDHTPPPACLPQCATIARMTVDIAGQTLALALEIHSQAPTYLPLPGDDQQWFPSQLALDEARAALFRQDGRLWLGVPTGVHRLTMRGPIAHTSQFTLPLPLKPKQVSVNASGWGVVGVERGLADDQLQFSRQLRPQDGHRPGPAPGALLPFARIERTLRLGLDWRAHTRVLRVSAAEAALVLKVPLLPGEAVTSPGIRVKDGQVEVNLPARQPAVDWESTLDKRDTLTLTAPPPGQWTEVWRADISPLWHVRMDGLAMVRQDRRQHWLPEWHPWPGEQVTLTLTRPAAADGQTLTIDDSLLTARLGRQRREVSLRLNLRSAQAAQHAITLPPGAALRTLAINGQEQPANLRGHTLTLPLGPGRQTVEATWQEQAPLTVASQTPAVDLGVASVNSRLNMRLGADRWVLFTAGPPLGPAVLFWSVLAVITLIAWALGRSRLTPLRPWQWWLLLLGLSQLPPVCSLAVAGWLMALGWRGRQHPASARFNAVQLTLAAWTVAALAILVAAVGQGLLNAPDMRISGNQSTAHDLNWYQDLSPATLPVATVVSVPLSVYRLCMLAWSLWLAVSLLNWLAWGWGCFARNGLWHRAAA